MIYMPPDRPKRILIVDDDDATRAITKAIVQAVGHEVETASDGIEALAKLGLGIDLVLLDVVMPGLDGFEVCRRIRRDPAVCDIPVIVLTSMDSRDDRLRAVEADPASTRSSTSTCRSMTRSQLALRRSNRKG